jgi:hypothetical protein
MILILIVELPFLIQAITSAFALIHAKGFKQSGHGEWFMGGEFWK